MNPNTQSKPSVVSDAIKAAEGITKSSEAIDASFKSPEANNTSFNSPEMAISPFKAIAAGGAVVMALFGIFQSLFNWIIRIYILPFELIARREIGERYLHPLIVLPSALLLVAFWQLEFFPFWVFVVSIVLFASFRVLHGILLFLRDKNGGEYWHSYSDGEPRLLVRPIDNWFYRMGFTLNFTKLFFEPLLLISIGLIIWFVQGPQSINFQVFGEYFYYDTNPMAVYFGLGGILLHLYQFEIWTDQKKQILDELDAQAILKARNLASEPQGIPTINTHKGVAFIPKAIRSKAG